MRLIDQLGIIATKVDSRVLNLIKDVEVCNFKEAINFPHDIESMITVGKQIPLHDLYKSVKSFRIRHVVQVDHDNYVYNLIMSAMVCRYPDAFLKNPLPMIMRTKGGETTTHTIPFNSSREKSKIMDKVSHFLNLSDRAAAQKDGALLVANELMMNALYSAPVDEKGEYLFADHPLTADVEFPKEEFGAILLSYNDNLLVIGCIDPFGSVDVPRVTKRLSEVFRYEGMAQAEVAGASGRGAGLGLKMVIENSSGFGMVVKKRQQTFVFATIPLGFGAKKVAGMSKNLFLKFY